MTRFILFCEFSSYSLQKTLHAVLTLTNLRSFSPVFLPSFSQVLSPVFFRDFFQVLSPVFFQSFSQVLFARFLANVSCNFCDRKENIFVVPHVSRVRSKISPLCNLIFFSRKSFPSKSFFHVSSSLLHAGCFSAMVTSVLFTQYMGYLMSFQRATRFEGSVASITGI